MSEDLIKREDAIVDIEYELELINSALDSTTLDFNARERLRQRRGEAREILKSIQTLPSADRPQSEKKMKILKDGTLCVTVDDSQKVKRVLVQDNYKFGGLYYPDAEPIVRCKDCKFFRAINDNDDLPWCGVWEEHTAEDGFCNWGERNRR